MLTSLITYTVSPNSVDDSPTVEDNSGTKPNIDDVLDVKELYYGRTMFSGDMLKAYDAILIDIDKWEDNANEVGEIGHIRIVTLLDKNIRITRDQLNQILIIMQQDIPAVYTQFPAARKIVLDGGFVKSFGFRYRQIAHADYVRDMKLIEAEANIILKKIKSDMTDAQKVRLIHDELLKLVRYGGMSTSESGYIRGAFILFQIICDGYAQAFTYLLQKIGIMSIAIIGQTPEGLHAWNKVKINNKWYNVDPTWNDSITGNSFHHDYFLQNDRNFHKNHTPNTGKFDYMYPDSANTDFPIDKTEYIKIKF